MRAVTSIIKIRKEPSDWLNKQKYNLQWLEENTQHFNSFIFTMHRHEQKLIIICQKLSLSKIYSILKNWKYTCMHIRIRKMHIDWQIWLQKTIMFQQLTLRRLNSRYSQTIIISILCFWDIGCVYYTTLLLRLFASAPKNTGY